MQLGSIVCLVLLCNGICATSYNILAIFTLPIKSHIYFAEPILKRLAQKGHNVTVIGYFPLKEKIGNYNDVVIGDTKFFTDTIDKIPIYDLGTADSLNKLTMYTTFLALDFVGQFGCKKLLESQNVQNFLTDGKTFDLAITEHFNSDCALSIIKKFDCPTIRVHSGYFMPWTAWRFGNPFNPAYMPNCFLPFSDKMTFLQRVENTALTLVHNIYFNKFAIQSESKLVNGNVGKHVKIFENDIYNDSLLLLNAHYTLNIPVPLVPNVIEIGGIHVGKNKSLPQVS